MTRHIYDNYHTYFIKSGNIEKLKKRPYTSLERKYRILRLIRLYRTNRLLQGRSCLF
ncbi:hypothetical protein CpB0324 [Chlamydia pneumoniae TW-183]|uniref:Uncharacterized protein n=1 Tax=Chlamydia pneumoniae TaxID=83558 RepID=A0ABN3YPU2_CHLPN|nr:hypothetical protein CpB0324 [Chlamydia pneumoniae TW-183]